MTQPHPMQPIALEHGVARFKRNAIIEHLLNTEALDLNAIAVMDFTDEDQMQVAQLLGYSVSGFADLDFASDEMVDAADAEVDKMLAAQEDEQPPAGHEQPEGSEPRGSSLDAVEQWAAERSPDQVFVLFNGGRPRSEAFRTVAGAQQRAAEILREYQQNVAELTPQEREETEELVDELDWALERDLLKLRDREVPMGSRTRSPGTPTRACSRSEPGPLTPDPPTVKNNEERRPRWPERWSPCVSSTTTETSSPSTTGS